VFGDITSGARSDLKQATRLARLMVCDWGMNENLGPQTFGNHEELMFLGREISRSQDFSEDTARKIDAEISALLRDAYHRAREIIEKHRDKLELITKALLERETLDARDVEDLMAHGRILPESERTPVEEPAEKAPGAAAPGAPPAAAPSVG
jgi:cell division protease FtsH